MDVEQKKDVVTRAVYGQLYRFRLWMALVDDIALLNVGHRLYHDHIIKSFALWRKAGVTFSQETGASLHEETLSKDDLYGFLGKDDESPPGPKRRISDHNLAILDAFLRAKYPSLEGTLDETETASAFAISCRQFFSPADHSELPFGIDGFLDDISGIYIQDVDDLISHITDIRRQGTRTGGLYAKSFIFRRLRNKDFCVVHKLYLPLRSDMFENDSNQQMTLRRYQGWIDRHSPVSTHIFSGIAFPVPNPNREIDLYSDMCNARSYALYAEFFCYEL